MSKKTWIIFAVIVIGLLVTLVVAKRNANPPVDVSAIDQNSILAASDANGNIADHVFGKADSKVVLIEYGDFQCPGCATVNPGIEKITKKYKDSIAFVFRNFPLTSIHSNAKAAAAAVEAAGLQGKYWEMHSLMYKNRKAWENSAGAQRTDLFVEYATSLELNKTKFEADLSEGSINKKLSFDQAVAKKANVDSTPTFYLNGTKISGDVVQDVQNGEGTQLQSAIDAELKKAGITSPTTAN